MYKVTFKTNRGEFTEEVQYFNFKVGDKVFTQSPYYQKRGTYKVVKIEETKKD